MTKEPNSQDPAGKSQQIRLAHGSGGAVMHRLIRDVFLAHLQSPQLSLLDDAAELTLDGSRVAFSTDTFVVKPLFYPGGNIGSLAISGTVNDLLVQGARPLYLSLGFVIEEGFRLNDLIRILESIAGTCKQAGVAVVTGDTKVVGRGEMDGLFINTAGVGIIPPHIDVRCANAKTGDAIIVSGDIGRHGIAVMAERHKLKLAGDIASDAAPLDAAILPLLDEFGTAVHVLRDPTRGGIATSLNEIAISSRVSVALDEAAIPVSESVKAVCDLLGFDPLYLPCEGRFLAFVEHAAADDIISFLKQFDISRNSSRIGEAIERSAVPAHLRTLTGGRRVLDMPEGELLPRIC